jgi:hypothetical protein
MSITPFELSLENELNVEWQKFANEWLFKWHGMTYEGGTTDVDDFRGGRIRYGGIKFGHQQQQVFWQAIDRYLLKKVHDIFKQWDIETAAYPTNIRKNSIDGVERSSRQFVHQILQRGADTDRRLKGGGYPENAKAFDASESMSRAEAEILRLAQSHRALLDAKIKDEDKDKTKAPTRKERIENFFSNNKGIMAAVGLLIGVLGLIKYFLR